MNVLSWIIMILGVLSPIVLFWLRRKNSILHISAMISPIGALALVTLGIKINSLLSENSIIGYAFFIVCISELTFVLFYGLIFFAKKGLLFIHSINRRTGISDETKLTTQISMLLLLLIFPNLAFAFIYVFWAILVITPIGFFDSVYYSFAVINSLDMPERLSTFQDVITNTNIRYVQVLHIVFSKVYEFIVIGYITGSVVSHIQDKILPRT